MPGIDDLKKLLAEYAEYLETSKQKFSLMSPAKITAEANAKHIPHTDNYYYPAPYFTAAFDKGGFIPIMLYNDAIFGGRLNAAQLDKKLQQWVTMKDKFQAALNDPHTFAGDYATWKKKDPAFNNLSEDQKKALYVLEQFREKYFKYNAREPLVNSVGDLSETRKIFGDCDSLAYVFGGLLLDATNAQGKKIFDQNRIRFDRFTDHARIQIAVPGKEAILFEASADVDPAFGERSADAAYAKLLVGNVQNRITPLEALGLQLYSEGKAPKGNAPYLMRTIGLAGCHDKQIMLNYAQEMYNLFVNEQNQVVDSVNALANSFNRNGNVSDKAYETAFQQFKQVQKHAKELEGFTQESDLKSGMEGMKKTLSDAQTMLKQIDPVKFEKLNKAYAQAETLDINSQSFSSLTALPLPLKARDNISRA